MIKRTDIPMDKELKRVGNIIPLLENIERLTDTLQDKLDVISIQVEYPYAPDDESESQLHIRLRNIERKLHTMSESLDI